VMLALPGSLFCFAPSSRLYRFLLPLEVFLLGGCGLSLRIPAPFLLPWRVNISRPSSFSYAFSLVSCARDASVPWRDFSGLAPVTISGTLR